MLLLDILLILLIFLGFIIGIIIAYFTQEELKLGRKYFIFLKKILVVILISLLLYYSWRNYIAFILGLIIGSFYKKDLFYLGFAVAGSFFVTQIIAFVVFLYNLLLGTLYFMENKKIKYKSLFDKLLIFVIPFFILLIGVNTKMAMAFAAGALIWKLK